MRLHRRGSWEDTRRELALIAWVVFLIDLIAIGIATLANKAMGGGVFFWGPVLAIYVTTVFSLIIALNLLVEFIAHLWLSRKPGKTARRSG